MSFQYGFEMSGTTNPIVGLVAAWLGATDAPLLAAWLAAAEGAADVPVPPQALAVNMTANAIAPTALQDRIDRPPRSHRARSRVVPSLGDAV
jgi:hypothetical protein